MQQDRFSRTMRVNAALCSDICCCPRLVQGLGSCQLP